MTKRLDHRMLARWTPLCGRVKLRLTGRHMDGGARAQYEPIVKNKAVVDRCRITKSTQATEVHVFRTCQPYRYVDCQRCYTCLNIRTVWNFVNS